MAKDDIVSIESESGVSGFDGKPFVNLQMRRVDGRAQSLQVRPNVARQIAVQLFEGAVEAERDAAMTSGLKEFGFEDDDVGRMLLLIREQREKWEDVV